MTLKYKLQNHILIVNIVSTYQVTGIENLCQKIKKMDIKDIEKNIEEHTLTNIEIAERQMNSIISKLPLSIQKYIEEAYEYQRVPKEYMLSSILNAFGTALGTKVKLDALGYTNYPNIYTVIVGSRGDVKSLAIDLAFKPIKQLDSKNYNNFQDEVESNAQSEVKTEVVRNQILIHNASIEKAKSVHNDNKISIGLYHDEIMHLFDKISNSNNRDGEEWKTFLLEGFTNSVIDIGRITSKSYRIEQGCPSLIGSIQNQLVYKVFENNNLESGFVDRLLFAVKLRGNNTVSKRSISEETKLNYTNLLDKALEQRKREIVEITLDYESENILHKYSQELVNKQKQFTSPINEYISKLNIYIFKLAIVVHAIKSLADRGGISNIIHEDSSNLAIELIEYYLSNFKIIAELNSRKPVDNSLSGVIAYAKTNGKKRIDVANFTGLNKSTVGRAWSK